jgi:DNA-directed RNA polymerase specialized sigma24 family protein
VVDLAVTDGDVHLAAIVAGDAPAFGRWMAGAEPRVRASLRAFARAVDVEAVVQETLLRAWQVAPRHVPDGRPDSLLRLAIRIGRNLAISEARRTRAAPSEPDDLDAALAAAAPTPTAPDPLLRAAIAACHDQLPAQPRAALAARLTSAGGHDDAQLAAGLRMRLNTFLQNVGRARRLIAACLARRGVAIDPALGQELT